LFFVTGHVFHPGHEELHGVTVLVTERSGRWTLGRYHETGPKGVIVHDAAIHEPGDATAGSVWLARQRKFGVRADHRLVVIPADGVVSIARFVDVDIEKP
jgi:hypothetical protein